MRNALVAALLLTTACAQTLADVPATPASAAAPAETGYDLAAQYAKFAPVTIAPDTSYLSAEEKQVVNLLNQAALLMSDIYLRQRYDANPALRAQIAASDAPNKALLLAMFDLHFGVWDTIAENHPFWGNIPYPPGAGFYPTDLTKAEFDAYLAAHPEQKAQLISPYTVVRREGDRLVAIPYSKYYAQWLEPAAKLLKQAAATTSNPSLKRFLNLRAKAFRTDDYY